MQVILIRHGETIWSGERRYQGIPDVPLSKAGRERLKAAGFKPARVYVTNLVRTRETAEILFPDVPQVIVPGLSEMNFGIFEGKNFGELRENPDYQAWVESGCLAACPGGESKETFSERVIKAFEDLMETGGDETVIVAHGGTLMAVLERFGRPRRGYFDWHAECGCGYLLDGGEWKRNNTLKLVKALDFRGDS